MFLSGVLGGRMFSQPNLTNPEITPAAVPAINTFFQLNFVINIHVLLSDPLYLL